MCSHYVNEIATYLLKIAYLNAQVREIKGVVSNVLIANYDSTHGLQIF